jgi:pilus assembly protein CpaE
MSAAASVSAPAPQPSPAANGRFLAAVADEVTRETVRATAVQLGWRAPEVIDGGVELLPSLIAGAATPTFLLADISDCADPVAALDAVAAQCETATRVVAVGLTNDVGLYRRLIAMGVSDYLVKPVSSPVLAEAILAATSDGEAEAPDAGQRKAAKLVSLIGARGGVGVTTLALSAGWLLAQDQRVVILDLDLHFGSTALSLDLELGRGLQEILTNPDRVDSLLIGAAMTKVEDRLQLLGAENPLEHSLDSGHEGMAALLGEFSGTADCVLVDTPRSLNGLCRQVLAVADVIAVVTDLSLPAMRDTRRLLAFAKGQRPRVQTLVVANRVAGGPGEVGRADFERGIDAKIDVVVPFDAKAAATAAERGRTFAESARNPATLTALKELTGAVSGTPVEIKRSMINRLLGR